MVIRSLEIAEVIGNIYLELTKYSKVQLWETFFSFLAHQNLDVVAQYWPTQ